MQQKRLEDQAAEEMLSELHFPGAPKMRVDPPGPKAAAILKKQKEFETGAVVYSKYFPTALEAGKGATIRDVDGNVFVDWLSGVSVLNVGHSNPWVTKAMSEQIANITQTLEIPTEARIRLLERLHAVLPGDLKGNSKILFSITGADAIEAAMKLARFVTKKSTVVAFEGAYHGIHAGALSATANAKHRSLGGGVMMPGIFRAPFPYLYRPPFGDDGDCVQQCLSFLERAFADPYSGLTDPAAIMLEPIQGESGVVPAPDEFMRGLRKIASDNGVLLITDEIQTGFGRTGKMWAGDWSGVTPDIVAMAKSIGGGIPLAAIAYRGEYDENLPVAFHIGTYRGNAVACAGGAEVIRFLQENRLVERAARLGVDVERAFLDIAASSRTLGDVRGRGLYFGLEFVKDKRTKKPDPETMVRVRDLFFKRGVIAYSAGHYGNVLRFIPPLTITRELIDRSMEIFADVVKRVESEA
jgi:4-aminobutyrate aminotransferase-like enzyme